MAKTYLHYLEEERKFTHVDQEYTAWAHSKGFFVQSAYAYGLTEENAHLYLSDYDFYKTWPLNSWSRIWVNDKLTLKLMLADKELEGFMPEYYYYSTNRTIKPLVDTPYHSEDVMGDFLKLLREKGEFACKLCNGQKAVGFYKVSYEEGNYKINEENVTEEELVSFVQDKNNYLYTEFIRPNEQFAAYGNLIHTIRVVVINEHGYDPTIIGGYMRLPNGNAKVTNMANINGYDDVTYNVYCGYDPETGVFGNGTRLFLTHKERISNHPDTGARLEGKIENMEELREKILFVSRKFSNLEYIGFDIGVTDKGFKCMEINTLPGNRMMQIFRPLYYNPYLKDYFARKIAAIDNMSDKEKEARSKIER